MHIINSLSFVAIFENINLRIKQETVFGTLEYRKENKHRPMYRVMKYEFSIYFMMLRKVFGCDF